MNREIKFRAWVKREKECFMAIQGEPDLETLESFIFHYGSNELMQFTGFKDNNGIDIYEGDIVHIRSVNYKYCCKFENGAFYLYHVVLKDWDNSDLRWGLLSRVFELNDMFPTVIGNIYENPETLQQ